MSLPESPEEAAVPATKGPTRVYENDEIRVLWDATRCTHVAHCMQALPAVFDSRRRPWVQLEAGDPDSVVRAVLTCPTGALKYESKGAVPDEAPPQSTEVEVRPNGPLMLRGVIRIVDRKGEVISEESRVSLCRCGASQNKPFCDNSHRQIEFRG